jgi:hypothetical protein
VIAEQHLPSDPRRRRARQELIAVAVCSAEGETYAAEGRTRSEALAIAAGLTGLFNTQRRSDAGSGVSPQRGATALQIV